MIKMHETQTRSSSTRLERDKTSLRVRVSKDGDRAAPKASSSANTLFFFTGQTRVQATHDKACLEQTLEHEAARSASLLSQVPLFPSTLVDLRSSARSLSFRLP